MKRKKFGEKAKKAKESKTKTKKLVFILLVLVIIPVVATFLTQYFLIEKVQTFDAFVTVADRIGFNLNATEDKLYFGAAPPTASLTRTLILDNTDPRPSKVIIKSYGQIKDWIIASENNFILRGNENKTVKIIIIVPENAEFGDYTGKIKLVFKKVLDFGL